MIKQFIKSTLFLLLIFSQGLMADNSSLEKTNKNGYETQLEHVLNQSSLADFRQLRLAYTKTDAYKPYNAGQVKEIFDALNNGDFQTCLSETEKLFNTNFTSIRGQYAAMVCNSEIGEQEKSKFHRYVLDGLMHSIGTSGDGQTEETAFIIISTDEAYAFLELAGYQTSSVALHQNNNKVYDLFYVKSMKNGQERQFYFDITIQMKKGFN